MAEHALVSTIIPVFNRPGMVRQAVESVLAQTYRPIEILVVNDGSTDDTPKVLAEMQAAHPGEIRVLNQRNLGAAAARERGRQAATGAYIQYLDSDDWLLPNKFVDQVAALEAHPECAIAYGISMACHGDGTVFATASRRTGERLDALFPALLVERWWHTHTPLFRRWISDAAGPWLEYRPEDWDLEARMGALRPRLIHCGSTVSMQRHYSSPDRVSEGSPAAYLRHEALFLPRLYACAVLAGVSPECPEMQRFSRWVFMRARDLDGLGETKTAGQLLRLARFTATENGLALHFYAGLRRIMGPGFSVRIAALLRGILGSGRPNESRRHARQN
ncbi:glycosyltransferase family 2 protein [Synechococcus sp. 1G10]|uniref:glycosyltransferase family 2 protein n=1 Tax=Synechococcus sp. 1G10 TaxID=2025605 RepID=UPI000B999857|nr:glycosyltransferase family 2 protein [Synechococcus sp. 1G10]